MKTDYAHIFKGDPDIRVGLTLKYSLPLDATGASPAASDMQLDDVQVYLAELKPKENGERAIPRDNSPRLELNPSGTGIEMVRLGYAFSYDGGGHVFATRRKREELQKARALFGAIPNARLDALKRASIVFKALPHADTDTHKYSYVTLTKLGPNLVGLAGAVERLRIKADAGECVPEAAS